MTEFDFHAGIENRVLNRGPVGGCVPYLTSPWGRMKIQGQEDFCGVVLARDWHPETPWFQIAGKWYETGSGMLHFYAITEEEFETAIDFLTRTGKKCDERRQEYMLLSDVLGVSMLVDAINHRFETGATTVSVGASSGSARNSISDGDVGAKVPNAASGSTGSRKLSAGKSLMTISPCSEWL